MADDILDGNKIVNFQDDSLTEDGLLIREAQNSMQIWKYSVFQPGNKETPCSKN